MFYPANVYGNIFLFKRKTLEDISPFCDTSGNVCFRFHSQGGSLRLRYLLPACNGILRFTSGAIPADHLAASMATEPF